jgi:predicted RNase H-like HicB family nuclease
MVEHVDLENLSDAEQARVRRYAMVIEWSDADEVFLVTLPDFPGAHTHGKTRAEAVEMGEEVLALLLHGEANPPAAAFTAMEYPVRPEAQVRETAGVGRAA